MTAVTRGQMASFLASVVRASGIALPDAPDAFADDAGSVHESNVNALAALRLVQGRADGSYGVDARVTRAQMASFLVRTTELVSGPVAPTDVDHFDDDDGDAHEQSIDAAASIGVAVGVGGRSYQPGQPVRREQMASFLVRLLDLFVESGHARPPASGDGAS
jgi:hypothetical protein